MHVLLRERKCDAFGIEALFDRFGEVKMNRPVVAGFNPGPDDKIDAAVSELRHGDGRCGIFEYSFVVTDY